MIYLCANKAAQNVANTIKPTLSVIHEDIKEIKKTLRTVNDKITSFLNKKIKKNKKITSFHQFGMMKNRCAVSVWKDPKINTIEGLLNAVEWSRKVANAVEWKSCYPFCETGFHVL
eukprot:487018_1